MIATKNIRGLLVTNAFLKNGKFVEHYEWLREAARQQEIRLDLCDNAMLHAIYGMESDEAKLASYSFIIFWDKDIRLAKWMERYCQKRGIPIFNTPEAVAAFDDKRENFREAFSDYSVDKICQYGENEIAQLLQNSGIVRNRRKIEAAINNARVFAEIQREFETFSNYIWHFTNGEIVHETSKTCSLLSDKVAKDMKIRGMKFIGTTTVYSYLQAIGMIYSHEPECFMYKEK